jgi:arginine decarboxylase
MSNFDHDEASDLSRIDNVDDWSIRDAETLYGIKRWGQGLFSVGKDGCLRVHPSADTRSIRIMDLVAETKTPVLIRFHDTLRHQANRLKRAFAKAIREEDYQASYFAAFPLKVNPYKEVLKTVFSDWDEDDHPMSFEVGSKPELLIALSMHRGKRFILCNGFKDRGYIDIAVRASKLGKPVFLIIEQLSELEYILEQSELHKHMPLLGIRVKLYSYGEGKWASSSGENSKFGLNTMEVMKLCNALKEEKLTDKLKLLHFHMGSQIPDIRTIKRALVEASQFYCHLHFMGFPMGYLDVGGGLAIDYDGTRTREWSSMNYTMEQYARDVVFNIKEICDQHKVEEPNILSESGRAIAGPHSFLIFEALSNVSKSSELLHGFVSHSAPRIIRDLQEILNNSARYNRLERLYDARQKREEAFALFNLGYMDLETRAAVESLFWRICMDIHGTLDESKFTPEELWTLDRSLSEQFVCNFSVFQSLPDHWALDQRFPIVPLQRLDEQPTVNARIVDITCDSDGEIHDYLGEDERNQTLLLHAQEEGKSYHIGVAFTGAYQDVLNTSHNLFDRTNEMQVWLTDPTEENSKGYKTFANNNASSVSDVLRNAQFSRQELLDLVASSLKEKTDANGMDAKGFVEEFTRQIDLTTYLDPS